jgi:hypothetical protein
LVRDVLAAEPDLSADARLWFRKPGMRPSQARWQR